jgi:peptidyl-prolyl cis-trans isomerase SurA
VAAAAVGIALTACSSPMQAGAAAVVGDQRITVSRLNADTESFRAALKKVQVDENQAFGGIPINNVVLQRMVNVAVADQLMGRYNVRASESEIDNALKDPGQYQSAEINLLANGVVPTDARDWGRAMVGLAKLQQQFGGESGQQRLAQEFNAIKPIVNPRYGAPNTAPQENPGIFVDTGRFGKLTATPPAQAQPPQG